MVDEIDREWWRRYRQELEAAFELEEIVIQTPPIERLLRLEHHITEALRRALCHQHRRPGPSTAR
jgi:hypothetical protein